MHVSFIFPPMFAIYTVNVERNPRTNSLTLPPDSANLPNKISSVTAWRIRDQLGTIMSNHVPDLTSKDKFALLAEIQDPPGLLQIKSVANIEQLESPCSLDVVLIQLVVRRDDGRLA